MNKNIIIMGLLISVSLQAGRHFTLAASGGNQNNGHFEERHVTFENGGTMHSISFGDISPDEFKRLEEEVEERIKNFSILPDKTTLCIATAIAGVYYCYQNSEQATSWFNSLSTSASNWWSNLFRK